MPRRTRRRSIFAATLAGLAALAAPTPPVAGIQLDLARAVETTLRANPRLLSVEEIRSQVKGGIREARADAFPQLTLSSSWGQSRSPSFLNSSDFGEIIDQFPGGAFVPSTHALLAEVDDRTRLVFVANPGNPTGRVYTADELERLRKVVLKHDIFLFADEVYREFCYDGTKHISAMNLEGISNNVVLIDSVSKRYSMCGARVGAFVSRNEELMGTAMKFAQARLSRFQKVFGRVVARRNVGR